LELYGAAGSPGSARLGLLKTRRRASLRRLALGRETSAGCGWIATLRRLRLPLAPGWRTPGNVCYVAFSATSSALASTFTPLRRPATFAEGAFRSMQRIPSSMLGVQRRASEVSSLIHRVNTA